ADILSASSGCQIEASGKLVLLAGTGAERKRAREYAKLMAGKPPKKLPVVANADTRKDVASVLVPREMMQSKWFKGQILEMSQGTKTIVFFSDWQGGDSSQCQLSFAGTKIETSDDLVAQLRESAEELAKMTMDWKDGGNWQTRAGSSSVAWKRAVEEQQQVDRTENEGKRARESEDRARRDALRALADAQAGGSQDGLGSSQPSSVRRPDDKRSGDWKWGPRGWEWTTGSSAWEAPPATPAGWRSAPPGTPAGLGGSSMAAPETPSFFGGKSSAGQGGAVPPPATPGWGAHASAAPETPGFMGGKN
ncbi:unnamed protein product, partial [Polarella glacialis]